MTPGAVPVALLVLGRALATDVNGPVKDSLGPVKDSLGPARLKSSSEQDQGPLKSHSLRLAICELINYKQLLSGVQA